LGGAPVLFAIARPVSSALVAWSRGAESFFRQLGFAAKPANESHCRPLNGLGDRLSVAEVILVALE
jgi:hypothetical protein